MVAIPIQQEERIASCGGEPVDVDGFVRFLRPGGELGGAIRIPFSSGVSADGGSGSSICALVDVRTLIRSGREVDSQQRPVKRPLLAEIKR